MDHHPKKPLVSHHYVMKHVVQLWLVYRRRHMIKPPHVLYKTLPDNYEVLEYKIRSSKVSNKRVSVTSSSVRTPGPINVIRKPLPFFGRLCNGRLQGVYKSIWKNHCLSISFTFCIWLYCIYESHHRIF